MQFLLHLTHLIFNNITDLTILTGKNWSSLFYNTSARHERHECHTNDTSAPPTSRVQHEWDTCDTSRHQCNTSATQTTRVRHEREILILITARVKAGYVSSYLHLKRFELEKRLSNTFKTTNIRKLINAILRSSYRVLQVICK